MSDQQLRDQLSPLANRELSALAEALANGTELPAETPQLGIELMYSPGELFRQAIPIIAEAIQGASDGRKTARPVDSTMYLLGMGGGGYTFGICNVQDAPEVIADHGLDFEGAFHRTQVRVFFNF